MNSNIKKIKYLHSGFSYFSLIFLVFILSCSTIMEPQGDAVAKPMIEHIEKYKKNSGQYPVSLMKLIPDYIPHYDFQVFIYKRNSARGKDMEEYVKNGLIVDGEGDGYELTVRFDNYTGECTYINGKRQSCRYIGHK